MITQEKNRPVHFHTHTHTQTHCTDIWLSEYLVPYTYGVLLLLLLLLLLLYTVRVCIYTGISVYFFGQVNSFFAIIESDDDRKRVYIIYI